MPSVANASMSKSRPVSSESSRRSREKNWRILLRALGVATNSSHSERGPDDMTFEVMISQVSPEASR